MGLGADLAGRTDIEPFASERARKEREVGEAPHKETAEVRGILMSHGLSEDDAARVAKSIKADKQRWGDFLMWLELDLEGPEPKRAGRSVLTISLAFIACGMRRPLAQSHRHPTHSRRVMPQLGEVSDDISSEPLAN